MLMRCFQLLKVTHQSLQGQGEGKEYEREDVEEGRINNQSALSLEGSEQSQLKMFDNVLLCKSENEDSPECSLNWNCSRMGGLENFNIFVLLVTSFRNQVPNLQKGWKRQHRLKRHHERFNVPFEYNVIAYKWETFQLEELKIKKDEVVVVNCLQWLKNLPDYTVRQTSASSETDQRNGINPELFIHGVTNGIYNVPLFVTRFREVLFLFSAQFDIFEGTVGRDDP
ncbi:hypothetical protein F3Y22_tig00111614pilonHSYRG00087 [Hibiscus syriacus]|uniref:Uncharacterized protein n=1 Tax=Hibiscus syriacus TaxID=106335 RepID=A0A6A2XLG4_HIBSY|nr:hypothetical protein F3Y22_tig00111614pilonHSYRG00087 [Hibiscus syriacus]